MGLYAELSSVSLLNYSFYDADLVVFHLLEIQPIPQLELDFEKAAPTTSLVVGAAAL